MPTTFETGYRSTLSAKLNATDTTCSVATAPTVTKGRMHVYKWSTHAWIKFTGVSGTTLTWVSFVSQTADPATSVTWTPFPAWTSIELVEMHDQMLDKQEWGTITWDIQFDWDVATTVSFKVPVYANATARDAGIPSPSNGMLIYNTWLWVLQQYISWAWASNASGTTVNADTTTAGKVEIATQSEVDSGTDVWGTWAFLSVLPSQTLALWTIADTQYESTIAAWDLIGQTPDGIYEIKTDVLTSTALGGTNTYMGHCMVSTWVFCLMYLTWGNATWVIATVSSSDSVTYWTPLNLGACSSWTWSVALIDTNKVVFVQMDGSSTTTHTATSTVCTISWTTLTAWTPLNTVHTSAWANVSAISSVFKVRSTAYWYAVKMRSWDTNAWLVQVNSVSGTTITLGTNIANYGTFSTNVVGCYLSDNYIAIAENGSSANAKVYIYNIAWGWTTVSTTYTGTWVSGSNPDSYIARYSATEFVYTNSGSTAMKIFTIPWAWTTLVETTLTANAASSYAPVQLFDGIYAVYTGTSFIIKQKDVTIWTISWVTALPNTTDAENIMYSNWRIVYFTGTTLIPNIINLARTFMIWVGYNTSWRFTTPKNVATKSGIVKGYRYYLQTDGSITNTLTLTNTATQTSLFWIWVMTDKIMLSI
jgi:hypothetical protein